MDNDTLRRILDNPEALAAVERIEGWRSLGDNIIETIINKSGKVKGLKKKGGDTGLTPKEKEELSAEEKEYKSKRKLVQEKLIKFATRIPAFMYLTDFRENTLQDVITKLEPDLFRAVTGLTVEDFHLLVQLRVFNTEQMNQAVFAFRRYEDASLRYTGIDSHPGLTHYGLYDTVVAKVKTPTSTRGAGKPWFALGSDHVLTLPAPSGRANARTSVNGGGLKGEEAARRCGLLSLGGKIAFAPEGSVGRVDDAATGCVVVVGGGCLGGPGGSDPSAWRRASTESAKKSNSRDS